MYNLEKTKSVRPERPYGRLSN